MQINLTGFLTAKNARIFMEELWELMLSAMENINCIPAKFVEQKKEEIKKRQVWFVVSSFLCVLAFDVKDKSSSSSFVRLSTSP